MNKPTIILYQPKKDNVGEVNTMPLGLMAISAVLDHNEVDIKIIDGAFVNSIEKEINKYKERDILLAGVAAITGPPIKDALKFARAIRKLNPRVPIVWGGYHPSINPINTVNDCNVDYVIKGQGEIPFKRLVNHLLNGKLPKDVPGIVMKNAGKIINNPMEAPRDINEFPDTPYHLIDIGKYIIPSQGLGERTVIYITSQGCPFNCSFCSEDVLYGNKWTGRPVEKMMKDIKMFYYEYHIDSIMFFDNDFYVNPKRVINLCKAILDEGIKIKWYSDIRIDQINRFEDKDLILFQQAGAEHFLVGAESGNNEVLKLCNKNIVADDIIKAAYKSKKAGIKVIYSFMTGFPEIYKKEFFDTLTLIERLREVDAESAVILCIYAPYPGTVLFDKYRDSITIPATLEEWSNYTQLNCNTKWMERKHIDMIESVSGFYIQCALSTAYTWKNVKLLGEKYLFIKIFHRIFQALAIFRLRHHYYKFRVEEQIVKIPLMIRRFLRNYYIKYKRRSL